MDSSSNLQLYPNEAPHLVLATLRQATYRRLYEARKSYKKNPASQEMDSSSNLQFCPNQAPHLVLATIGQAKYRRLHEARKMNHASRVMDLGTIMPQTCSSALTGHPHIDLW